MTVVDTMTDEEAQAKLQEMFDAFHEEVSPEEAEKGFNELCVKAAKINPELGLDMRAVADTLRALDEADAALIKAFDALRAGEPIELDTKLRVHINRSHAVGLTAIKLVHYLLSQAAKAISQNNQVIINEHLPENWIQD